MSALSRLVTAQLESLKRDGHDQKAIATSIHERLLADGEVRAPEASTSIARIEELLSKLKSGRGAEYAKAAKFVFKTDTRVASVAAALHVDEPRLRNAFARRSVLLDPNLPSPVHAYLEERAADPNCRADIEASDARTLDALLAVAKDLPGCLVVLADHRSSERGFFAASDIATTGVTKHRGGWLLTDARELIELPPPKPLELSRDGQICVPHEEYESFLAKQGHADRIEEAWTRGEVPTFAVSDVLRFLGRHSPEIKPLDGEESWRRSRRRDDAIFDVLEALRGAESKSKSLWWIHEQRVFVAGRDIERLRAAVAPYHPVHEPTSLQLQVEQVGGLNPFASSPTAAWRELVAEVNRDIGLSIEPIVARRRDELTSQSRPSLARATFSREPCDVRERIAALLKREFIFDKCDAPEVPFLLDAVARAPLAVGPTDDAITAHVVANLGAGQIVRVLLRSFPKEATCPLVVQRSDRSDSPWAELDGGDVHVWIYARRAVEILEGCALPARARRNADADDWDDD